MTHVPSRASIVDDHGHLITWAVRKLNVPINAMEDARQGGVIGLLVALDRYEPSKGRYRAFAANHVLHEVRSSAGWDRRQRVATTVLGARAYEIESADSESQYDTAMNADAIAAVKCFVDTLEPTDRVIYERIYQDERTQTDVAAELKTNKMAVSRRLAQIHNAARVFLAGYAVAA